MMGFVKMHEEDENLTSLKDISKDKERESEGLNMHFCVLNFDTRKFALVKVNSADLD